jgi:hypothetical protein
MAFCDGRQFIDGTGEVDTNPLLRRRSGRDVKGRRRQVHATSPTRRSGGSSSGQHVCTVGSHKRYRVTVGGVTASTAVPQHPGDIPTGTLRKIDTTAVALAAARLRLSAAVVAAQSAITPPCTRRPASTDSRISPTVSGTLNVPRQHACPVRK